jgi:hypothetical protein
VSVHDAALSSKGDSLAPAADTTPAFRDWRIVFQLKSCRVRVKSRAVPDVIGRPSPALKLTLRQIQ